MTDDDKKHTTAAFVVDVQQGCPTSLAHLVEAERSHAHVKATRWGVLVFLGASGLLYDRGTGEALTLWLPACLGATVVLSVAHAVFAHLTISSLRTAWVYAHLCDGNHNIDSTPPSGAQMPTGRGAKKP